MRVRKVALRVKYFLDGKELGEEEAFAFVVVGGDNFFITHSGRSTLHVAGAARFFPSQYRGMKSFAKKHCLEVIE
jgi:hypothetical protein